MNNIKELPDEDFHKLFSDMVIERARRDLVRTTKILEKMRKRKLLIEGEKIHKKVQRRIDRVVETEAKKKHETEVAQWV